MRTAPRNNSRISMRTSSCSTSIGALPARQNRLRRTPAVHWYLFPPGSRICGVCAAGGTTSRNGLASTRATTSGAQVDEPAEKYRRCYRVPGDLLRREGVVANHKRMFRLYRVSGLGLKRRRKKRVSRSRREPIAPPSKPNER